MHELVEMEVRELLSNYDYDGDNAVFIKGSALCALNGTEPELGEKAMEKLVHALDTEFEQPVRLKDKDFLMSVDSAMNISGRGTVVTGTVEQGKCKVGDEVHMIGMKRKPMNTTITGIEMFHKSLDYGEAGDNVGVLVRGLTKDQIRRGMCIIKPGTLDVRRNFEG